MEHSESDSSSSLDERRRRRRKDQKKRRKRHEEKGRRKKKHKRRSDNDSDVSSVGSSSVDSEAKKRRRRHRKRGRKEKKRERREKTRHRPDDDSSPLPPSHKETVEDAPKHPITANSSEAPQSFSSSKTATVVTDPAAPQPLQTKVKKAPMSREEYEALRNTVREIYDEQTGRYRLVRGTGEIIERIVSRQDHQSINRQATYGDGQSFARQVYRQAKK